MSGYLTWENIYPIVKSVVGFVAIVVVVHGAWLAAVDHQIKRATMRFMTATGILIFLQAFSTMTAPSVDSDVSSITEMMASWRVGMERLTPGSSMSVNAAQQMWNMGVTVSIIIWKGIVETGLIYIPIAWVLISAAISWASSRGMEAAIKILVLSLMWTLVCGPVTSPLGSAVIKVAGDVARVMGETLADDAQVKSIRDSMQKTVKPIDDKYKIGSGDSAVVYTKTDLMLAESSAGMTEDQRGLTAPLAAFVKAANPDQYSENLTMHALGMDGSDVLDGQLYHRVAVSNIDWVEPLGRNRGGYHETYERYIDRDMVASSGFMGIFSHDVPSIWMDSVFREPSGPTGEIMPVPAGAKVGYIPWSNATNAGDASTQIRTAYTDMCKKEIDSLNATIMGLQAKADAGGATGMYKSEIDSYKQKVERLQGYIAGAGGINVVAVTRGGRGLLGLIADDVKAGFLSSDGKDAFQNHEITKSATWGYLLFAYPDKVREILGITPTAPESVDSAGVDVDTLYSNGSSGSGSLVTNSYWTMFGSTPNYRSTIAQYKISGSLLSPIQSLLGWVAAASMQLAGVVAVYLAQLLYQLIMPIIVQIAMVMVGLGLLFLMAGYPISAFLSMFPNKWNLMLDWTKGVFWVCAWLPTIWLGLFLVRNGNPTYIPENPFGAYAMVSLGGLLIIGSPFFANLAFNPGMSGLTAFMGAVTAIGTKAIGAAAGGIGLAASAAGAAAGGAGKAVSSAAGAVMTGQDGVKDGSPGSMEGPSRSANTVPAALSVAGISQRAQGLVDRGASAIQERGADLTAAVSGAAGDGVLGRSATALTAGATAGLASLTKGSASLVGGEMRTLQEMANVGGASTGDKLGQGWAAAQKGDFVRAENLARGKGNEISDRDYSSSSGGKSGGPGGRSKDEKGSKTPAKSGEQPESISEAGSSRSGSDLPNASPAPSTSSSAGYKPTVTPAAGLAERDAAKMEYNSASARVSPLTTRDAEGKSIPNPKPASIEDGKAATEALNASIRSGDVGAMTNATRTAVGTVEKMAGSPDQAVAAASKPMASNVAAMTKDVSSVMRDRIVGDGHLGANESAPVAVTSLPMSDAVGRSKAAQESRQHATAANVAMGQAQNELLSPEERGKHLHSAAISAHKAAVTAVRSGDSGVQTDAQMALHNVAGAVIEGGADKHPEAARQTARGLGQFAPPEPAKPSAPTAPPSVSGLAGGKQDPVLQGHLRNTDRLLTAAPSVETIGAAQATSGLAIERAAQNGVPNQVLDAGQRVLSSANAAASLPPTQAGTAAVQMHAAENLVKVSSAYDGAAASYRASAAALAPSDGTPPNREVAQQQSILVTKAGQAEAVASYARHQAVTLAHTAQESQRTHYLATGNEPSREALVDMHARAAAVVTSAGPPPASSSTQSAPVATGSTDVSFAPAPAPAQAASSPVQSASTRSTTPSGATTTPVLQATPPASAVVSPGTSVQESISGPTMAVPDAMTGGAAVIPQTPASGSGVVVGGGDSTGAAAKPPQPKDARP